MTTWTYTPIIETRDGDQVSALRTQAQAVVTSAQATAHDRERRWESAWRSIAYIVAGFFIWQGAGFVSGGNHVTTSRNWGALTRWLPGGLHTHGGIMLVLGVLLLRELWRGDYRHWTLWVVRACRFYCTVVALCWFMSWFLYGLSWSGPAWWTLLAMLTVWLTSYRPALDTHSDAARGGTSSSR